VVSAPRSAPSSISVQQRSRCEAPQTPSSQTSGTPNRHRSQQRRRRPLVPRFPPLEAFERRPTRRVRTVAHGPTSETLHNSGHSEVCAGVTAPDALRMRCTCNHAVTTGLSEGPKRMATPAGLEPATYRLEGAESNRSHNRRESAPFDANTRNCTRGRRRAQGHARELAWDLVQRRRTEWSPESVTEV
jgi:hypothetical protein